MHLIMTRDYDPRELWQTIQHRHHTFEVQARAGTPQTNGKPFVLMQDVEDIFLGASRLQYGKKVLGFMVDEQGNRLTPLRVPYIPGAVLEVVVSPGPHTNNSGTNVINNNNNNAFNTAIRTNIQGANDREILPAPPRHSERPRHPQLHEQPLADQTSNQKHRPQHLPHPLLQEKQPSYHQKRLQQKENPAFALPPLPPFSSPSSARSPHRPISQFLTPAPPLPPISPDEVEAKFQTSCDLYQSFLQHIRSGQMDQANTVTEDFRKSFSCLEPEMCRNLDLRQQMVNMQQNMVRIQQQSFHRMTAVQHGIKRILLQNFELHESALPRLFIVLPRDSSRWDGENLWENRFKVYFLCECGEHTAKAASSASNNMGVSLSPGHGHIHEGSALGHLYGRRSSGSFSLIRKRSSSSINSSSVGSIFSAHSASNYGGFTSVNSKASSTTNSTGSGGRPIIASISGASWKPHHIHLAKHEGYDLECAPEFFRRYGRYVLRLLQMLKFGVTVAGYVVPSLHTAGGGAGDDSASSRSRNVIERNLELGVDQAIEFLEAIADQDDLARDTEADRDEESVIDTLQSSDLRELGGFIKQDENDSDGDGDSGSNGVAGNLYRIVTGDGHIKWVCLDHYRDSHDTLANKELKDIVKVTNGSFDEHMGRVQISLSSPALASQFYRALERARSVQELHLVLTWEISLGDAKLLRNSMSRSCIAIISLNCTSCSNTAVGFLNRNKRAEPLWQILSSPRTRSFVLEGYSGFFKKGFLESGQKNQIRSLRISEEIDWGKDSTKVLELLRASPHLSVLSLSLVDSVSIYEAYQDIRDTVIAKPCPIRELTLESTSNNTPNSVTSSNDNTTASINNSTNSLSNKHEERLVALYEKQLLISINLTIPTISEYSRLLQSVESLSSLHLTSRTIRFTDPQPLLDLLRRNKHLLDLKISCYVSDFSFFLQTIRRAVVVMPSLHGESSGLRQLCLYRDGNRFYTPDIHAPHLLALEILQLRVHEKSLLQLVQTYGSHITKLKIDCSKWRAVLSTALLDAITQDPATATTGSRLTHLYQTCSDVDESVLEDLATVIGQSSKLEEYILFVDRPFREDRYRSMQWVEFMNIIGEKLTALGIAIWAEPNEWIDALKNSKSDFKVMPTIQVVDPGLGGGGEVPNPWGMFTLTPVNYEEKAVKETPDSIYMHKMYEYKF